jgi:hypothetical protein
MLCFQSPVTLHVFRSKYLSQHPILERSQICHSLRVRDSWQNYSSAYFNLYRDCQAAYIPKLGVVSHLRYTSTFICVTVNTQKMFQTKFCAYLWLILTYLWPILTYSTFRCSIRLMAMKRKAKYEFCVTANLLTYIRYKYVFRRFITMSNLRTPHSGSLRPSVSKSSMAYGPYSLTSASFRMRAHTRLSSAFFLHLLTTTNFRSFWEEPNHLKFGTLASYRHVTTLTH